MGGWVGGWPLVRQPAPTCSRMQQKKCVPGMHPSHLQADLIGGKYMKAPPDAALADKAASKARKAQKRSGASGDASIAGTQRDFRRYQSPSGFAVLVGRNSRQNDELTCRMAQPGDVWMHARSAAGAADSWLSLRCSSMLACASQRTSLHTCLLDPPLSDLIFSCSAWLPVQGGARGTPADAHPRGAGAGGG